MKTESLLQNKAVIVVLAIAGIAMVYVFGQIQSKGTQSYFSELAPVNYIMGKVKSKERSEFSLEGREIDNQYLALQKKAALAKAKDQEKKITESKNLKTEVAKAQEKQKTNLKKRADAQRQAFAKQQAYKKMIAARNAQAKLAESRKAAKSAQELVAVGVYAQSHNQKVQDSKKEKPTKTLEQWRAELYASPTNEFVAKMTAALKSGDITENNYFMLITELVNSDDSKMIGLGLYALRSSPSIKSFSMLVSLETSVGSSYLKYVQDSLMSYHKSSHRSVLAQALASSDRTLVKRTLQILKVGMTNIQSGQASTMVDPRDVRDAGSTAYSMDGYSLMLPALEAILASGDPELAQLAQQNIEIIDNSHMVAQN